MKKKREDILEKNVDIFWLGIITTIVGFIIALTSIYNLILFYLGIVIFIVGIIIIGFYKFILYKTLGPFPTGQVLSQSLQSYKKKYKK